MTERLSACLSGLDIPLSCFLSIVSTSWRWMWPPRQLGFGLESCIVVIADGINKVVA